MADPIPLGVKPEDLGVDVGPQWGRFSTQLISKLEQNSPGQHVDGERVIVYPKTRSDIAAAHQQLLQALTAEEINSATGLHNSGYFGVSNGRADLMDGRQIVYFMYPDSASLEVCRTKLDALLNHTNRLLRTVGARELLPEIPK